MSHNNFIKFLLEIKDKNIFFDENHYFEERIINSVRVKVFLAKLTYSPDSCPHCSSNSNIIKYGFKPSLIKILNISNFYAYLSLKKQRFLCKNCNHTFIAHTSFVEKFSNISNSTKIAIALAAKDKISEKDIAKRFNVSHSTVNRVINSFFNDFIPDKNYLPNVLCFDEFKSTKDCSGSMSFIMYDPIKKKIIDIVENRQLNHLINYFSKYSFNARKNVKHIVIDMYSPYISLIKKMFPNAKISIDRFHIVQHINRAFNKSRISVMKKYNKTDSSLYNKLKNYWKLFLKPYTELSYERKYNKSFKRYISEKEIIDYLLEADKELEKAYDTYQDFLYTVKDKEIDKFKLMIEKYKKTSNKYIKTVIETFKKYIKYIENSLKYKYTNGGLEGVNNKIKVIKRIGFGYRSFLNLRRRILIMSNLLEIRK